LLTRRKRNEDEIMSFRIVKYGRRWALSAALVAVTLCAITVQAQAPKRIALVGGMLLDGWEVPPIHHAAVLIEGNRIVQVGPASDVKIPPDATVIDTSGQTMMPGLIELHATFTAIRPVHEAASCWRWH
jgi:imidazolonepropionase-like amidohydrolase